MEMAVAARLRSWSASASSQWRAAASAMEPTAALAWAWGLPQQGPGHGLEFDALFPHFFNDFLAVVAEFAD